jgi:hypothetical protein
MHLFDTLLPGHGFSWPLARPGVAPRPLAANRQSLSVTDTSVTGDISQAGDILANLPAKLSAYHVTALDNLRDSAQLVFRQLARLGIHVNLRLFKNLHGSMSAYAVNIGQRNPYCFLIGYINTNNTRHTSSLLTSFSRDAFSALSLLVAGIAANHVHNALATHNPAILTNTSY